MIPIILKITIKERKRRILQLLFLKILYQCRFYGIFWKILSRIIRENLFLIIYEEREIYNKSIAMASIVEAKLD